MTTAKYRRVATAEENVRSLYDVLVDGVVVGWVKCYDSDGAWTWSTKTTEQTCTASRAYAAHLLIESTKGA